MRRSQINKLIETSKNRRLFISLFSILAIILVVASFSCMYFSLTREDEYYIHYDEKSDLDYTVFLKPNEYLGTSLGKDRQYIASLIDYIQADFSYSLDLEEQYPFKYNYYIEAEVTVEDSNGKYLYSDKEEILSRKEGTPQDYAFDINEKVYLDYAKYNEVVRKFVKKYNLMSTKSTLTVSMYVGIEGDCEDGETSLSDDAVVTMQIPLTTNTVGIDMNYVVTDAVDQLLQCSNYSIIDNNMFIVACVLIVITILEIIVFIIYVNKTRSVKSLYSKKLKKIFNSYGRYISRVKSEIDYKKYQMVFVEDIIDLLEIRDCSQTPLLFVEDKEKLKSVFMVPSDTGLIYIYYLSAIDLKK